MTQRTTKMKLGVFLYQPGHHVAAWRHPDARADGGMSFQHHVDMVRLAERAKFDMAFIADTLGVWGTDIRDLSRSVKFVAQFEPLTLLSALSVVTEHIGLVATATTTYNEPFHVARKFASLDHLSNGRAGWNVVTSSNESEALNFSRDAHSAHADRYARAREFVHVVKGLWDSWEDDAFLYDKDAGLYFDERKLHVPDHRGEHFSVRGPLNVARPLQGHPVLFEAGQSEAGKTLAAETAEGIFTIQQSLADAQAFYMDLKARVETAGRSPRHLKVMPGVFPIVGRTADEAEEKYAQLQALVHPDVGMALLSAMLGGADLSGCRLDDPLPELHDTNAGKSRLAMLVRTAREQKLTVKELYLSVACARGHWIVRGTPQHIADQLEERFTQRAADGFIVMPPTFPGGFVDFVEHVVPELQRRGLFRTEYEGRTLRDHLELPRPANRFAR
ncbi:LLM class flavin-dependent oxidoreductase [Burkholderia ubonensis]|uniref:LLM class flavin-dependent oxidoreductase n=1 Tax=Burkholderia ubonensis TaxID=101571 RepID=UPI00075D191D|nr:LLM class flavin-dependent oxidoreductase [Burkholderia ubonensis]KVZ35394.1 nitrilotriacetate monooxygenase [Burkholderia ubonensis]